MTGTIIRPNLHKIRGPQQSLARVLCSARATADFELCQLTNADLRMSLTGYTSYFNSRIVEAGSVR